MPAAFSAPGDAAYDYTSGLPGAGTLSSANGAMGIPDPNVGKYQSFLSAYNLANAFGDARRANRFQSQAQRIRGLLGDSANGITGMDFTDPNFSMSQAMGLSHTYGGGGAAFNKKLDLLRGENQAKANTKYETEKVNPAFDQAQSTLDSQSHIPLYGTDFISKQRSQIAQSIQGAKAQSLRRVAAALGMRGMDPSSPAGAAIASRAALDADQALVDQLRSFGMDVESGNRQSAARFAALASDLATKRLMAHTALANNDQNAILGIGSSISQIVTAMQAQQAQQQQARRDEQQATRLGYLDAAVKLGQQAAGAAGSMAGAPGAGMQFGNTPTGYNSAGYAQSNPYSFSARPTNSDAGWY